MKKNETARGEGSFSRLKAFIEETDILILLLAPILVGFGGLLAWGFVVVKLTGEDLHPPGNYVAVGIASLIASLSGFAEIIKREMPGPFGQIFKGKIAVVSGILLIALFGGLGIFLVAGGLLGMK